MSKEKVLEVFRMLAGSQGAYGRILCDIGYNGENVGDEWFTQFGGCKDALDVVLVMES